MVQTKSSASETPLIAANDSQQNVELNANQSAEPKETLEINGNANAALEEKAATTAVEEEQEAEALQNQPNGEENGGEGKTEEAIQPVESTIPEVVHTVDDIYDFDDISGRNAIGNGNG